MTASGNFSFCLESVADLQEDGNLYSTWGLWLLRITEDVLCLHVDFEV